MYTTHKLISTGANCMRIGTFNKNGIEYSETCIEYTAAEHGSDASGRRWHAPQPVQTAHLAAVAAHA